jgi:hypothetical protein
MRPSAALVTNLLVVGIGTTGFAAFLMNPSHEWATKGIGLLIAGVMVTIGLSAALRSIWHGGALRTAPATSSLVRLISHEPVWFMTYTGAEGIGLEFWSINERPLFPGFTVQFTIRSIAGAASAAEETALTRSLPPWWLRSRHSRLQTVVFRDLSPGQDYEVGVVLVDARRSEAVVRIYSAPTLVLSEWA